MNRAGALLAVQAWAGGLGWGLVQKQGKRAERVSYGYRTLVPYGSDYRYSYGSGYRYSYEYSFV